MEKNGDMGTAKCEPRPANYSGRPTWAEVNLDALLYNYKTLCSLLDCGLRIADCGFDDNAPNEIRDPQSATDSFVIRHSSFVTPRLIPVVKADAYGHGIVPVARTLAAAGTTAFAVAIVEEGILLRQGGIEQEVLVLEGAWPGQEEEALRHALTPAVHSPAGVRRLGRAAQQMGQRVRIQVKIDTGMTRLGIPWDAMRPLLDALQDAGHLGVTGTFSHFAAAEEADTSFTAEQIRRFESSLAIMRQSGLNPGEVHIANSAGLIYRHNRIGQSARPGIALYGYPPAPQRCPVRFRPVLSLKSRIGCIHTIQPGESVGYNRRFIASRETRTATLPVGYADGYRRGLTGVARVIIRDRWAAVLGAVSMDTIVVDITHLPEVDEGEEAIMLGSSRSCCVDAAVWADLLGTIPYEVLCGISPRVPRIYRDRASPQLIS